MIEINGFCRIPSMIDNSKESTALIGELSSTSYSFSRDKKYHRGRATDVELVVFDSTKENTDYELTLDDINTITDVLQWTFEKSVSNVFTASSDAARELIQSNFSSTIADVSVSAMEFVDGAYYPKYVSFNKLGIGENKISIWLSDTTFKHQYGGFEILAVDPKISLDIFHRTKGEVEEALSDFTIEKHNSDITDVIGEYPCTLFKTNPYTWFDKEDKTQHLSTYWSVVVYGAAGNNPSRIKRALQDHILANSNYPRSEWVKVFPEIFTSTEFTFIPMWENENGHNLTNRASTYSPVFPYEQFKEKAQWFFETVELKDSVDINKMLERNLSFIPVHYKSLGAVLISGESNPEDKQVFTELYKDYSIVPVSSNELSRVEPDTSEFIYMLVTAISYAESLYGFEVIGNEYSVLKLNGVAFYVFEHNNIEYRVLIHPDAQADYV